MTNYIVKTRSFINDVMAELKKSAWPTRKELIDSTVVVIVTVVILGLFVAFADFVFSRIVSLFTRSA
jgi:preprotein translocase subunit SecE